MAVSVEFTDDPAIAEDASRAFLRADPVRNNVVCTLLEGRRASRTPIRFWWASERGELTGVVFQSPDSFPATVSRVAESSVEPLARAVSEVDGPPIPGVIGVADDASRFAGEFASVTRRPGHAVEGQRIYEIDDVAPPDGASGTSRIATDADVDLVAEWVRGFDADTNPDGELPADTTERAARYVGSGRLHLWEVDGVPTTSAIAQPPAAGVVRVGFVYTPPAHRRHGYAGALVAAVSSEVLADGDRCILYTQLSNPTSNAIYQRLGYRAVAEVVRYAFR